jgi:serine/threonine-protein kinase RsbW
VISDFEERLASDLGGIPALAASFAAWAEEAALAASDIACVNLALEELVTNVIEHGLGPGRPGWISLRVSHGGDRLAIELRDNAPPFDPFQVPSPNLAMPLDERPAGGLGVHLVRAMMDDWSYARDGDENVVSLRRNLHAGAG